MTLVAKRIKFMPIHEAEPYLTLQKGQNCVVKAQNQILHVISGVAWVSNCGEDYIVKAGEAITLFTGGDNVAVIAGLKNKPVQYTLKS